MAKEKGTEAIITAVQDQALKAAVQDQAICQKKYQLQLTAMWRYYEMWKSMERSGTPDWS